MKGRAINRSDLVLIPAWIILLVNHCFANPEPVSKISKLTLQKCCQDGEFLGDDGICSNFEKISNNSEQISRELKNWRLPKDLFYFSEKFPLDEFIIINGFVTKRPNCNGKAKIRKILGPNHIAPTIENVFSFLETPDGNDTEDPTQNLLLHKDDFCIDKTERGEYLAEMCIANCENAGGCVAKCCLPHQILDLHNFACVDVENDKYWHPVIKIQAPVSDDRDEARGSEDGPIVSISKTGLPKCEMGSYNVDFRDRIGYKSVSLLSSGNLELESLEGKLIQISSSRFCVDGILEEKIPKLSEQIGKINYDQFAIVCFDEEEHELYEADVLEAYRPVLFPILTGISSMFLLLTSIIYLILWKEMHLPGWLQLSYTTSLLVAFTLLTVVQIWTEQLRGSLLCPMIGYTLHGTFLSCFFWLTSMNIDLWCSFRNTPVTTGFGRSRGRRRYFAFAAFSISIPVGVTLAAVLIDSVQRSGNELMRTEIGESSCALNIRNKSGQLYYFYGVVGLLLLVNLMFFFCTVLCLRERQRETKFAHRQCTAADSDMQRFRLFTRLFFVMGILWIFELISWITAYLNLDRNIQLIFVVTDCLNALQGLGVFLIFVWKRNTWKQLRKKYRKILRLDSRTSLMGPSTVKSSVKSSTTTKSGSVSSKTVSPT